MKFKPPTDFEISKIAELLQIIRKGDNIVFDNKFGVFKITKIGDVGE